MRKKGFHATGLSEIIRESGVPKGSVYHHYPDGKLGLAVASISKVNDRVVQYLEALAEKAERDPIRAISLFCDYYATEMMKGDDKFQRGCPLATVTLEAAATVDEIQDVCNDGFSRMTALFSGLIREAGVPEIEADELASMTISGIEGALILCRAQRDVAPLRIAERHISQMILHSISTHEATS